MTAEPSPGEQIGRRRRELGLSKTTAARLANVSRRTWHEIEFDQRPNVTKDTGAKIDHLCGWPDGTTWEMLHPRSGQLATHNPLADLIEDISIAMQRYAKALRSEGHDG
jgi:transcriptional regulator with XRE-family HTH domain